MNFADLFRHETQLIEVRAGAKIIETGQLADRAYVLLQGEAEVVAGVTSLGRVQAGELFGEMALIESAPASVDVIARSDCRLAPIDQKRFNFLVQQTPNFALEVMKLMAARLRNMNQKAGHSD